ncbi:MAG: hypothetical protein NVS1B12_15310 [Acidimicrobiales bacterium]
MTVLRRYAPFLLLAVAQLFLVIVVPSRAPKPGTVAAFGAGGAGGGGGAGNAASGGSIDSGAAGATGATGIGAAGPGTGSGTGGAGGAGGANAAGPVPGGGVRLPSGAVVAAGDTSHCKGGKQFDDSMFPSGTASPPCTPAFAGNNGGATYAGVTASTVELVYYRPQENQAVDAALQTQGLYASPADEKAAVQKFVDWANGHFELFGRKIHLDYYQGNCSYAPVNANCLRVEAGTVVSQFHPFAIVWATQVAPEFFDEYSRRGVVNMGGWHFDDSFSTQRRPYHYDVFMGGTFQSSLTGEFWCKGLAGKPARFAGNALKAKTRKAAVLVPESPTFASTGQELANNIKSCDHNGAEVVTYSQDTGTAAEQATTQVAKLKGDGITSILCVCDPIAPSYFTKAATSQAFFPEHVIVGSGLIDYDPLGRLYDPQQWAHAFGLSDLTNPVAFESSDAAIAWRQAGGAGSPADRGANLPLAYIAFFGYSLNEVGPNLTPASFESAVLNAPARDVYSQSHDPKKAELYAHSGKYNLIADARLVYWDPNATSQIDGKQGAYVPLNGGARYTYGQMPSGEPSGVPSRA